MQLIILLYLIDNNTDTSWMILYVCQGFRSMFLTHSAYYSFGSGMGVLIEAWKVCTALVTPLIHNANVDI